ncbi:MAG: hypothetical protein AB1916_03165 [Thermodesulfobacteriota bacterium]
MRTHFQKAAVILFVLTLLAVADGLAWSIREPFHTFRVTAGSETIASGTLDISLDADGIKAHSEVSRSGDSRELNTYLRYTASSPDVQLEFVELRGTLWRALVRAPATLPAGAVDFVIYARVQPPTDKTPRYTLRVFDTPEALRADIPSLAIRHLGFEPWWVVMACLPLAGLFGFLVFRATGEEEDALISRGIAPIYKLAKRKEGWDILFGLGEKQGLQTGEDLVLLTPDGQVVVSFRPGQIGPTSTRATLDPGVEIRPDYYVARPHSETAILRRSAPGRAD